MAPDRRVRQTPLGHSPGWSTPPRPTDPTATTVERVASFRFATMASPGSCTSTPRCPRYRTASFTAFRRGAESNTSVSWASTSTAWPAQPASRSLPRGKARRRTPAAVTSYAVEGATFAESTSRIDEKASRSETYVDITRGRSANHLYLTRAADPLDGEHLPKAPAPPIATSVATRLHGSGPERAAVDIDPGAPEAGSARAGGDVAELHARALDTAADPSVVAAPSSAPPRSPGSHAAESTPRSSSVSRPEAMSPSWPASGTKWWPTSASSSPAGK